MIYYINRTIINTINLLLLISRRSRTAVLLSVLVACILRHTADAYDNAYIHTGCVIEEDHYPEYYTDDDCNQKYGTTTGCSLGEGWYCNDEMDVNNLPNGVFFDDAVINDGCGAARFPTGWYCFDDGPSGVIDWNSFIYPGCDESLRYYFVYQYDGDCPIGSCAFGEGWYCNDDEDISDWDWHYFDNSFIHYDCNDRVGDECVWFNIDVNAWLCNDWL
jgi:hypothetical protein